MSPTVDAFLRSWPFDPWLAVALVLTGGIYLRGWLVLSRRDAQRWHGGHLAAFLAGLATLYLALASPIEPFASLLLEMHMVQHLLLMIVAPPLFWLGAPLFPVLCGLPEEVRTYWVGPLLRWRPLRQRFGWLVHPLVAWPLFVAANWLWHLPPSYELALRDPLWHFAEHACFFLTGLVFWYPVVRPYPSRPRWSEWLLFPYLILTEVQNTLLAAWLSFAPDVLYPHYANVPRLGGISALDDQAAAGVIMWVPGSLVLLVALFAVGVSVLSGPRDRRRCAVSISARRAPATSTFALPILDALPTMTRPPRRPVFDLLEVSLVGRFLRWRPGRMILQGLMALLAGVIVYDGLRGPQTAPTNLAGVVPWIHWRGVLVFGLLVAGNFFCMACPFTLPRAHGAPLAAGRAKLAALACATSGWPWRWSHCSCGATRPSPCGTVPGSPPGSSSLTSPGRWRSTACSAARRSANTSARSASSTSCSRSSRRWK